MRLLVRIYEYSGDIFHSAEAEEGEGVGGWGLGGSDEAISPS